MVDLNAYYEPPSSGPSLAPTQRRPGVWAWYVAYCVFMALFYLMLCIAGLVFLVVDPSDLDTTRVEALITGTLMIVFSAPLGFAFGIAPLLPRRKWAWSVDLVLIGFGLTSCGCIPMVLPLLIIWLKPETKTWFGYPPPPPRPSPPRPPPPSPPPPPLPAL